MATKEPMPKSRTGTKSLTAKAPKPMALVRLVIRQGSQVLRMVARKRLALPAAPPSRSQTAKMCMPSAMTITATKSGSARLTGVRLCPRRVMQASASATAPPRQAMSAATWAPCRRKP